MNHNNHRLVLVLTDASLTVPIDITDIGDVTLTGTPVIVDAEAQNIYCYTCEIWVSAGLDGLAEEWDIV